MIINKKIIVLTIASTLFGISTSTAFAMPTNNFKPIIINNFNKQTSGINKISSYQWINPYTRSNGTYVQGHMRSRANGVCWDNIRGCR